MSSLETIIMGTRPGRVPSENPTAELNDLYRLYCHEWVTVTVASGPAEAGADEPFARIIEVFEQQYRGRIHDDDVDVSATTQGNQIVVSLRLRRPVLKAEFKTNGLAEAYRTEHTLTDAVIAQRNSADDHALRGYGIRKLTS